MICSSTADFISHHTDHCPLCDSPKYGELLEGNYGHCANCDLRFLIPRLRLGFQEEKDRYRQHQNSLENLGYVQFLTPLLSAAKYLQIHPGSEGLDFGSGPNPVLSKMYEQSGYKMSIFDPFFAPQHEVLEKTYDFVATSEVAEHFFAPAREFQLLKTLLKPKAHLLLMTSLCDPQINFATWHYRRDPTHVTFYSKQTCLYIAQQFRFSKIEFFKSNIVLFQN